MLSEKQLPSTEEGVSIPHIGVFKTFINHVYGQPARFWRSLQHARITMELASSQRRVMIVFVLLAIVNAATDGFSVMLIVPLLDSFSTASVFRGVPFLQDIGKLLQPLEPSYRLRVVAGLIFAIILIKGMAQYAMEVIVYIIPQRVERDLRLRAFKAVMHARLTYSESISAGDISNYTSSFPARTGISARFFCQMIASLLVIMLMMSLIVAITPKVVFALGAFAIIASIAFKRLTGPLSRRLDHENTHANADFSQAYFEAVANKRTIRIFNATDTFMKRIARLLEKLRHIGTLTVMVENATYPFFATLAGVLVCGAALIASLYQPENAQAFLGVMLIFLVAAFRLLGPFSVFHIARMHYAIHSEAVLKLHTFMKEAEAAHDEDGDKSLPEGHPQISFEKVSFAYEPGNPVLSNIDLKIEPGTFVAIVGRSGSGKSTILSLLNRLSRPESGTIRINGVPLNELRISDWSKNLSFISQEVPIFNATVAENILFGSDENVSETRLEDALRLSAADSFVDRLPSGRETSLGEFGSMLSGGERQRLALARAFYHRRPVILLDEVTSQLDGETERWVQNSIMQLREQKHTIIAIAHRLSTIRNADCIHLLDDGKIVASGTHEDLLERSALYQSMVGSTGASEPKAP